MLTQLERLLELLMTDVRSTLNQAVHLVAEALAAERVDVFLHNVATDTLIALDANGTPSGSSDHVIGMDQVPLVRGDPLVEVFLTGVPYLIGQADQNSEKVVEVRAEPGARSEVATVIKVESQHRGVLLASCRHKFFSEQDVYFLQAVAQWIGIEIHRAELVERVRQEALEQSPHQRAEELVTIMAHDMRNYLTPLKGRLGRMELRAHREMREQDVSDVTAASNTLNLLERVISDLLDVRRLNQGIFTVHPQPLYLVALVQEVVPAFSGPETPIHVHAPQEIVLWADPDRIRQVLENLLANAVKYAPKHTPITIQVDKEKRVDRPWVILRVSNAGPGLSSELRAQLVRPFVAGVTSKGLGLGLYLANKIAVAHNGTLTVDSPRGQGVQVTFALPIKVNEYN